jgi:hypothetical protein
MNARARMRLRSGLGTLGVLIGPLAAAAGAQDLPAPTVEVAVGWVGFADDAVVSEPMVGGAGRFHLLPRLSMGPEFTYIQGDRHSHLVLTGNLTWDLVPRASPGRRRVVPFLVAGAGLFRTREQFFGRDFSSTEGAFTVGGGLRARTSDRTTVGVDARIGWELHLRVAGVVGVQLGR